MSLWCDNQRFWHWRVRADPVWRRVKFCYGKAPGKIDELAVDVSSHFGWQVALYQDQLDLDPDIPLERMR